MTGYRDRDWPNVWWLALGYFCFYAPYSALVKVLADGRWLGSYELVSGFELLPAIVIGSLVSVPVVLGVSGLWRKATTRRLCGFEAPVPRPDTLRSGFFAAIIVGTTTINYTFEGISILLALLLMRGGVLILCPCVDYATGRRVEWYSWAALGLSLLAVSIALYGLPRYAFPVLAALNLSAYLLAYLGRFRIMARSAKTDDVRATRRYFVEEHLCTMPILLGLIAVGALILPGPTGVALRRGFTSFLATDAALPAFGVGVLYELLFVFGTLIYLDRGAYTYCVPVNRGMSLLAGLSAAVFLWLQYGYPPPNIFSLFALFLVGLALLVLLWGPKQKNSRLRSRTGPVELGTFTFVCAGNTKRSPLAAALCRDAIAKHLGITREDLPTLGVRIVSAGLKVDEYAPMPPLARKALAALGVTETCHNARPLDASLIRVSEAVFCMTESQRQEIVRLVPEASHKVWRLDPANDLPEPSAETLFAYMQCARRIREVVDHVCEFRLLASMQVRQEGVR